MVVFTLRVFVLATLGVLLSISTLSSGYPTKRVAEQNVRNFLEQLRCRMSDSMKIANVDIPKLDPLYIYTASIPSSRESKRTNSANGVINGLQTFVVNSIDVRDTPNGVDIAFDLSWSEIVVDINNDEMNLSQHLTNANLKHRSSLDEKQRQLNIIENKFTVGDVLVTANDNHNNAMNNMLGNYMTELLKRRIRSDQFMIMPTDWQGPVKNLSDSNLKTIHDIVNGRTDMLSPVPHGTSCAVTASQENDSSANVDNNSRENSRETSRRNGVRNVNRIDPNHVSKHRRH